MNLYSFCCCYFMFPPWKIVKKNARRIHSEFVCRGNTTGYLYSVTALGVLQIYTRSFVRITWQFILHSEYFFQVRSEKITGPKICMQNEKTKIGFYA